MSALRKVGHKYTVPEEVGHDHMHMKSGRVPYIELLYHLQVQAIKPWRQFQRTNCVKIHANKILVQYPSRPPFRRQIKLSETSAIYVTLLGDIFLKCGLSHHYNGVAMIPVIDLGHNNTPEVHFSFAAFIHVSCSGTRASVQRS